MTKYKEQIQRIKTKLLEAQKKDTKLEVFGATAHKYILHQPLTEIEIISVEKNYDIKIPDCYKAFITQIGNGGVSFANSAAGPFYGIYPFGENINELIQKDTKKYLNNECILYPRMTDDFWKNLTEKIYNNNISYIDAEKEKGKIYAGILPIGSQGCTFCHGIILNGKYKGKVVNLDSEGQKPLFAFENNFLDWYERWLDEIISNDFNNQESIWFAYEKGGSEDELLTLFSNSDDLEEKNDNLRGLLNKKKLSVNTINQIETLISKKTEPLIMLIQLLCKSDYKRAKPHLLQLIETDLCSAFRIIYWYAKNKSKEWLKIIEDNIYRIDDDETFGFCTQLLIETKTDFGKLILPFTKSNNNNIKSQAYNTLGFLKNKVDYIDYFIEGLKDNSSQVVLATLQSLSYIKNKKLLKYYKNLAEKFPEENNNIHTTLNYRLAEFGMTCKSILNMNIK